MGAYSMPAGSVEFGPAGAARMTVREQHGGFVEQLHVILPDADCPALIGMGDKQLTIAGAWRLARGLELMVAIAKGLNGDRFS